MELNKFVFTVFKPHIMKKFFYAALIIPALLGACSDEGPEETPAPPEPGSGKGTLLIKPRINVVAGNDVPQMQETPADDFSTYTVILSGTEVNKTMSFPDGGVIDELAPGKYTVTVKSHADDFVQPAFDVQVYEGSAEATVTKDDTAETTVPCVQTNAGVFFAFDASLAGTEWEAAVPTASYGSSSLVFEGENRKSAGYFPAGDVTLSLSLEGESLLMDGNESQTVGFGAGQLWEMTLTLTETDGKQCLALTAEEVNDPESARTWTVGKVPPPIEGTPVEGSALTDYPEEQAAAITTLTVTGNIPSDDAWRALNKFTSLEHLVIYDDAGTMPDYLFYDEASRTPTMPQLVSVKAPYLTGIGGHALFAASIRTLEVPSLKSIGLFGLAGCMNLETLSLPEVESLDNYTLSECTGLVSVDMPKVVMLSQGTFDMCIKLTEVNLPNVTEAGSGVFYRCDALETVSLPKLAKAGKNFLSHCAMLKGAELPELAEGDEAMFAGCSSLENVSDIDMPKLKAMPQYMFYNCAGLKTASHANVTDIGPMAFQECPLLESVSFPNALTVGKQAFEIAPALRSVSLPKAETISEKAFYKCTALTSAEIPSAKTVGDFAFCLDAQLSELTMNAVETIGNSAFYDTGITAVELPQLVSCAKEAFRQCKALASVSMPKLTALSNYMFGQCTSLRNVEIPALETAGGDHIFDGCTALESVSFPLLKDIGAYMFNGATSLVTVSVPKAETVGNSAFLRTAITRIDLPEATSLGTYVFDRCDKLSEVKLPKAVAVGNYCFTACTGLEAIELPAARTVSLGTFNGCTALKSVSLPAADNIGKWSFRNCTALTELSFGAAGEIVFGDLVFAHLPVQDPQTITPACTLKLNSSGTEMGNAEGNVWKGYAWKAIESCIP